MGLFKEISCAHCGNKAGMLSRLKLKDGNYLCWDCQKIIPDSIRDSWAALNGAENYQGLLDYKKKSDSEYKPQFNGTFSYGEIEIDENHGLFRIGYDDTLIYSFANVVDFDFGFVAETVKEGIFKDKVKGKSIGYIVLSNPFASYSGTIKNREKTKGNLNFLKTKVVYDHPDGLLAFEEKFIVLYCMFNRTDNSFSSQYAGGQQRTELDKALSLFMVDDITELTIEKLNNIRRRLMKSFHPDNGPGEIDEKYAKKINQAYDLLFEAL